MPRILHVLLDLPLLPTRRRITKLSIKEVVTCHRQEPGIDLALLADPHAINGCAHVVVDAPSRHATQNPEGVMMRIEQHLMTLQRVSPERDRPAMRQLHMRDLQLGPHATQQGPVLAPIELKGFAGCKGQWNERTTATGLLLTLPFGPPNASKRRNTVIRAVIT